MTDQMPPPENGGNGARKVSNWELILLAEKIDRKIDNLSTQMAMANAASQSQGVQLATNTQEIASLRDHYHEISGGMQTVGANSVLLPTETRRELVRLLPWVQMAERHLGEEKIIRLDNDLKRKEQREVRWFGMSRELALFVGAFLSLLLANPLGQALWHALAGH